jgi:flagellar motor switch protein FliN/FliY
MSNTSAKLTGHIEKSLRDALNSLTGSEFTVAAVDTQTGAVAEDPFIWQQTFSVVDAPALWLSAGKDLWEALGRMTLESAGIDTVTPEDCKSTWQEINSQTVAGIASAVTADVLREVSAGKGEELTAEPSGLDWIEFRITGADGKKWALRVAWSVGLTRLYDAPDDVEGHREPRSQAARDNSASRTFDLLLEVPLPVSVSFGKTSLQIREVLKLSTGSIVELNRFVTDPVEVIVNDCVIARGEVVVVDGNYGVRISQLASREDRLRSGMSEGSRIGLRP